MSQVARSFDHLEAYARDQNKLHARQARCHERHARRAVPYIMKVILLGNAGAGKSTLARRMIARHPAAWLSLDEVAFQGGAERRPVQDSIDNVRRWIAGKDSWIIEGCYADIIEAVLESCDELIFLNPGVDACIAHCRSRPWEPDKFASRREQDEHLDNLLQWVRSYESRTDEYGLSRHRELYESFQGRKRELNHPREYEALLQPVAALSPRGED